MKLKDILTTEIHDKWGDMDVANDVTDELWPAWCGEALTDEGLRVFGPVLELEAEIAPVWGAPGIVLLIDKDNNWEEELDAAGNLFNAMAGYCDADEYDLWFADEEDEPILGPMPSGFISDQEKMRDFFYLTKDEFLASYSYLTEEEYDDTLRYVRYIQEGRRM